MVKQPVKPRTINNLQTLQHIDPEKKVRVYRNLHKNCFSVKQDGIVKCHAENIVLQDCQLIVSEAGRQKVLLEKKKNVHAYIEGKLVDPKIIAFLPAYGWRQLYYNPYKTKDWSDKVTQQKASPPRYVDMDIDGGESMVLSWGKR